MEWHPHDTGGDRNERPHNRGHSPDQHSDVTAPREPLIGTLETLRCQVQQPATPLNERPASVVADRPANQRASEIAKCSHQRHSEIAADAVPERVSEKAAAGRSASTSIRTNTAQSPCVAIAEVTDAVSAASSIPYASARATATRSPASAAARSRAVTVVTGRPVCPRRCGRSMCSQCETLLGIVATTIS